jgi:hypothetical protein
MLSTKDLVEVVGHMQPPSARKEVLGRKQAKTSF